MIFAKELKSIADSVVLNIKVEASRKVAALAPDIDVMLIQRARQGLYDFDYVLSSDIEYCEAVADALVSFYRDRGFASAHSHKGNYKVHISWKN